MNRMQKGSRRTNSKLSHRTNVHQSSKRLIVSHSLSNLTHSHATHLSPYSTIARPVSTTVKRSLTTSSCVRNSTHQYASRKTTSALNVKSTIIQPFAQLSSKPTTINDEPSGAFVGLNDEGPQAKKPRKTTTKRASKKTQQGSALALPTEMKLSITISDPEVIEYLHQYQDKSSSNEVYQNALRIGVLSLKNAQHNFDTTTIRNEIDRMMSHLQTQLQQHRTSVHDSVAIKLQEYFDPSNGRFEERVQRLTQADGELATVIRDQITKSSVTITNNLIPLLGPGSRLLNALDVDSKTGVVNTIQWAVGEVINDTNNKILTQFSLDNKNSALSRFISELRQLQHETNNNNLQYLQTVADQLSLDNPKSSLSRLIRSDLISTIQKQSQAIKDMEQLLVRELAVLNTKRNAMHDISRKTTLHGIEFEDKLFSLITQLTSGSRPSIGIDGKAIEMNDPISSYSSSDHIIEPVGNRTGTIRNCKVGDIIITMGPEHIAAGSRIVIEAKNDSSYNLNRAINELSIARKNRGADIGIFVYSKTNPLPDFQEHVKRFGDDIVVMFDPDDLNTHVYVDAALSIAKALLVRRQTSIDSTQTQHSNQMILNGLLSKIDHQIHDLEKEMSMMTEIKRYADTIVSSSEKILSRLRVSGTRINDNIILLSQTIGDIRQLKLDSQPPSHDVDRM